MNQHDFNQRAVHAIRAFSIDAIQKAKSGHPGTPLGAAPIGWELFAHQMRYNPQNPDWVDRDRFILSAGHASMLLYSLLYLLGFGLKSSDIAGFRQWASRTPGHPEFGETAGVEMSTGPLGQGLASAVGFALAETQLAAKFNRPGREIVNHYTYVFCGDGCLQEGVSSEACSFAGTQKLGKLIVLYDRNQITIEGSTDLAFTEDVAERYRAYGWQVLECHNANDMAALAARLDEARAEKEKPSLVIIHSEIGYASPLAGSEKTHGSPLGEDNIRLTKESMGWPLDAEPFAIPEELQEGLEEIRKRLAAEEANWNKNFASWRRENPELAQEWDLWHENKLSLQNLKDFGKAVEKPEATRKSSGRVLNQLASALPNLIGGSADLAPSNNSWIDGGDVFSPQNRLGRNIHYGIREFAMACIMNGIILHGGLRSYCATFFVFSDYMRNAIRLAALMNIPSLFVFTHDSIGVGEDGPTHQPIEQLSSLRAMPNLLVFRPADAVETAGSYKAALESGRPSAFVLSRQNLSQQPESNVEKTARGAYVLKDEGKPELILLASGSEVELMLKVQAALKDKGIGSRTVSVPCMELFLEEDESYQEEVLPKALCKRLAAEAAEPMSWYRLLGSEGRVHGIERFGASAPAGRLFEEFGFTVEKLTQEAMELLTAK